MAEGEDAPKPDFRNGFPVLDPIKELGAEAFAFSEKLLG
jgi:hypothetical protein